MPRGILCSISNTSTSTKSNFFIYKNTILPSGENGNALTGDSNVRARQLSGISPASAKSTP